MLLFVVKCAPSNTLITHKNHSIITTPSECCNDIAILICVLSQVMAFIMSTLSTLQLHTGVFHVLTPIQQSKSSSIKRQKYPTLVIATVHNQFSVNFLHPKVCQSELIISAENEPLLLPALITAAPRTRYPILGRSSRLSDYESESEMMAKPWLHSDLAPRDTVRRILSHSVPQRRPSSMLCSLVKITVRS